VSLRGELARTAVAAVAVHLASCTVGLAAPVVRVVEQETILLGLRSPGAALVGAPPDGVVRLALAPGASTEAELSVRWPGADRTSLVRIRAQARPPVETGGQLVRLEAAVERPDGSKSRSSREIGFEEATTALFEVDRTGGAGLTLVVEAEIERERTLAVRSTVGAAVVFHLEVRRLEATGEVELETNRLSTFVGEPVTYSFRLGDTVEAESLRVELTPLGLYGDLIQVEIDVDGKLRDGTGVRLVNRHERWLGSRGESTSVDVSAGDPPTGFRFVVAPEF
jgi:hypothetical protein